MPRIDRTERYTPEQRRLDTVAKFLTGNSVVCAVILEMPPAATAAVPKLLISNNSLTRGDAVALSKSFSHEQSTDAEGGGSGGSLSKKSQELLDLLRFFKELDPAKNLPDIAKLFYNKSLEYVGLKTKLESYSSVAATKASPAFDPTKIDEAIKSLAGDRGEAVKHIKVLRKIEVGDFKKAVNFFLMNEKDLVAKNWGKGIPKTFFDKLSNLDKTLWHDSKKLAELLITDKYPILKNTLLQESFVIVGPSIDKASSVSQDFHAERNLIDYLIENSKCGDWYVGINKLCCFGCANDVALINQYSEVLKINTRGSHNVEYPRIDPEGLHIAIKKLEVTEYREAKEAFSHLPKSTIAQTLESADLSGSEVEVELGGEEGAASSA